VNQLKAKFVAAYPHLALAIIVLTVVSGIAARGFPPGTAAQRWALAVSSSLRGDFGTAPPLPAAPAPAPR
jgi:hypothetical protein